MDHTHSRKIETERRKTIDWKWAKLYTCKSAFPSIDMDESFKNDAKPFRKFRVSNRGFYMINFTITHSTYSHMKSSLSRNNTSNTLFDRNCVLISYLSLRALNIFEKSNAISNVMKYQNIFLGGEWELTCGEIQTAIFKNCTF